jgi:hypothetical protein
MKKSSNVITKFDLEEGLCGLREEMQEYKDEIISGIDEIMKMLRIIREESYWHIPNSKS